MPQEFTHLLPLERPIWARYLAATTEEFLSLVYDLHLAKALRSILLYLWALRPSSPR